ncbi:UNVERIFIED_CONTAM: hypothetical protein FKN15_029459 [Acipenser sinensis]
MSLTPRCSLVSSSFVKHLELQDGIGSQQTVVTALNATGEEIIQQTFADDAGIFKEKLASVNARWQEVCRLVAERRRRYKTWGETCRRQKAKPVILLSSPLDLAEGDGFLLPLDVGPVAKSIAPTSHISQKRNHDTETKFLQAGFIALWSCVENNQGRLKKPSQSNSLFHFFYQQVSRDLPEKQKDIEYLLRGVTQFQQQLHQLALWASTTKDQLELYRQVGIPGAFDTKETEDEAQAKQADVEAILSKAHQLYKEKPITQPIKGKLEDLSSDWKTINTLLLQLKGKPEASRVISTGVCQTVTVLSQTLVTKGTTTSKLEMPSSLLMEVPAMADFNKAWVELTDWLSLLHHVIKTQIVTVGDLEEINDMIVKQKATLQDLEQRHPQLEDLITAAQNLKNKTNNPEARATITDRIDKVQVQWEEVQGRLQSRRQQLQEMLKDSSQWLEAKQEAEQVLERAKAKLESWKEISYTVEALKKQNADLKQFVKELRQWQINIDVANDLARKLLRDYSADDTRRVDLLTESMNKSWASINKKNRYRSPLVEKGLSSDRFKTNVTQMGPKRMPGRMFDGTFHQRSTSQQVQDTLNLWCLSLRGCSAKALNQACKGGLQERSLARLVSGDLWPAVSWEDGLLDNRNFTGGDAKEGGRADRVCEDPEKRGEHSEQNILSAKACCLSACSGPRHATQSSCGSLAGNLASQVTQRWNPSAKRRSAEHRAPTCRGACTECQAPSVEHRSAERRGACTEPQVLSTKHQALHQRAKALTQKNAEALCAEARVLSVKTLCTRCRNVS